MQAGILARALRPVVAGLSALGHDASAILHAAGVDQALLEDPEARVPHAAAIAMWERGAELTGDPNLGLHVAEQAPLESFDVHAYAVLSSATLRDAFERACRYQRLIHEATRLELASEDTAARLRHVLPGGRAVPRQSAEFLLATYVRLGRRAAGRPWSPLEVRFAHGAPEDVEEHERLFTSRLCFSMGENSLLIANDVLDAANPAADAGLLAILDRHASDLLARVPSSGSLSDRVRSELSRTLSDGPLSAEATAERLGMSVRSLGRGLSAEDTTFRELLDQLRHERAVNLLSGSATSIAEIAFLLGFSEVSAFYRAFKRWTGVTPVEFRAR